MNGPTTSNADGHVEVTLLERYAAGTLPDAAAWSVEAHVTSCASCRSTLTTAATGVDATRLDAIWDAVSSDVRHHDRPWLERLLARAGVAEHDARLLAATRSLTTSWLVGVALVLAAGVGTAWLTPGDGVSAVFPFLLLAPLVPLAGVAVAFGPRVDPTYELGIVAPMSSARLLLVRAVAVVVASMVLATVATLTLPVVGWASVAWLAPSLALTSATLAASTRWSPPAAATVLAVAWVAVVGGLELRAPASLVAFGSLGQGVSAVVLAASAVLLVLARDRVDPAART